MIIKYNYNSKYIGGNTCNLTYCNKQNINDNNTNTNTALSFLKTIYDAMPMLDLESYNVKLKTYEIEFYFYW